MVARGQGWEVGEMGELSVGLFVLLFFILFSLNSLFKFFIKEDLSRELTSMFIFPYGENEEACQMWGQ